MTGKFNCCSSILEFWLGILQSKSYRLRFASNARIKTTPIQRSHCRHSRLWKKRVKQFIPLCREQSRPYFDRSYQVFDTNQINEHSNNAVWTKDLLSESLKKQYDILNNDQDWSKELNSKELKVKCHSRNTNTIITTRLVGPSSKQRCCCVR